ncbi:hypothetical protein RRG08_036479 [Elysia crispata]|uniref:Uncharacterized protein n=1 Tax=Elysia crispata TaxID=231223 RepID=A0AAE1DHG9_9GAST|nr:hypothetical protein RRG08_036479 [Elysia crispata]
MSLSEFPLTGLHHTFLMDFIFAPGIPHRSILKLDNETGGRSSSLPPASIPTRSLPEEKSFSSSFHPTPS